ncbi:Uncharacterized conserved protein UCP014753 [Emticicia oligotrophica DSM 17448]|uniref:Uncharacterized conserved protein UCP014753 n=1 Tax=Emticicia oligotrophica (strain DSM 17448 / CIP 109782 / MTCC 6937 / GPTSA100-15) TaxID=929562 RepID=A0ABN4AJR0_EMTOG|nr:DUF2264 domain-containing protein [Emticicia oligotrophica]AFK02390.1 Uncharacterized conserved protein UCP014753 [Emticicia oligotrophica DSM 17448]
MKKILIFFTFLTLNALLVVAQTPETGQQNRAYWSKLLYKISYPVIHNLSQETLVKNMPIETGPNTYKREMPVSHLESVGRTVAGIAPWLALEDDNTEEGNLRKTLREKLLQGLRNMVNPKSPDYLNFRKDMQPLVDAAFLAQGFLRAKNKLWDPLDDITKKRFVEEFKALRNRKAYYSNWLLFAATTEAFLLKIGEDYDPARIDYALKKIPEWYFGDGIYGDGPSFAMDYYNSFVIHPMLVEVLKVMVDANLAKKEEYDLALKRMIRYAEHQERFISPEGTYPPIGRSIAYRVGAFHVLALAALQNNLSPYMKPAQVRCALTKVMKNQFEAEGTFDANGWLQLGFAGHQTEIAEPYISTGSLYLCTFGFLPLGLPASHPFWTDAPADWTSKKAWSGQAFKKDAHVD